MFPDLDDVTDDIVQAAAERGDVEELRRFSEQGSSDATDLLLGAATEREDLAELRRLAELGSRDAAEVLAELTDLE